MYNPISSISEVDFTQFKDIVFVGDIHGHFDEIEHLCTLVEHTIFIQVGDFGAGFSHPTEFRYDMERLAQRLQSSHNCCLAIRGNHDDPKYFDNRHYKGTVFLLRDNQILEACGQKLLLVGGAYSVDRIDRTVGQTYWVGESASVDFDVAATARGLTGVVTHTCPGSFPCAQAKSSLVDYYAGKDTTLRADLAREQALLQDLYDVILKNNKIDYWVHGHFHYSQVSTDQNGVNRWLLAINECRSPTVWSSRTDDSVTA